MYSMFSLSQSKVKNILFLDLYKSHVSLVFIDKQSNKKNILEVSSTLNHLRVAKPKYELYDTALTDLLASLSEKLAKKSAKYNINLTNFHILVSVHGESTKVKNYKFFIKLKEKEELSTRKLAKIVNTELTEETEFLRIASEKRKFFKSKKLISQIAPNYYKIKTWESKRVNEFSFLVTQSLIEMNLKNILDRSISAIYPESDISFINSNVMLALALQEKQNGGNLNILDIGMEFISFYQLYDAQVINFQTIKYSAGNIIRTMDEFIETYELSESQIVNYLAGNCNGDFCKKIEKSLYDFDLKLQSSVAKLELNPYLREKILFVHNPDLNDIFALWIADRFAYHLNKKAKLKISDTPTEQKDVLTEFLYSKNFHNDLENKLIII